MRALYSISLAGEFSVSCGAGARVSCAERLSLGVARSCRLVGAEFFRRSKHTLRATPQATTFLQGLIRVAAAAARTEPGDERDERSARLSRRTRRPQTHHDHLTSLATENLNKHRFTTHTLRSGMNQSKLASIGTCDDAL